MYQDLLLASPQCGVFSSRPMSGSESFMKKSAIKHVDQIYICIMSIPLYPRACQTPSEHLIFTLSFSPKYRSFHAVSMRLGAKRTCKMQRKHMSCLYLLVFTAYRPSESGIKKGS